MLRVDAVPDIAVVEHQEAPIKHAEVEHRRISMSAYVPGFLSWRTYAGVSIRSDRPSPKPTVTGLINLGPKAFIHRLQFRHHFPLMREMRG